MKRLAMRKIRGALRLQEQGLSPGKIGASLGIDRTTIQEDLSRARAAGLSWPLIDAAMPVLRRFGENA